MTGPAVEPDVGSMIKVQVKSGAKSHDIEIAKDATVAQLQQTLESLTGTFIRKQKIIFKGKVLEPKATLAAAHVADGAKLMLLASADAASTGGSGALTKGQETAQAAKKARAEEAQQRVAAAFAAARSGVPIPTASTSSAAARPSAAPANGHSVRVDWAERRRAWAKTGIVGLRDLGLAALPADVFGPPAPIMPAANAVPPAVGVAEFAAERQQLAVLLPGSGAAAQPVAGQAGSSSHGAPVGSSQAAAAAAAAPAAAAVAASGSSSAGCATATHADLSCNRLQGLPSCIGNLTSLVSLKVSQNALTDQGVPWQALAQLTCLTLLSLDSNQLTSLHGPALRALPALRHLSASGNALAALPGHDLGSLTALQVLHVDSNALAALPEELCGCSALEEVSACSNKITVIPAAYGVMDKLQTLRLDNNRVTAVPPALLHGATSLWQLHLNGNPLTVETLRETDGWAEFDARRRAKCDKQMSGRVLMDTSRAFNEGADVAQWSHWGPGQLDKR